MMTGTSQDQLAMGTGWERRLYLPFLMLSQVRGYIGLEFGEHMTLITRNKMWGVTSFHELLLSWVHTSEDKSYCHMI
jgi:hypothetical protein